MKWIVSIIGLVAVLGACGGPSDADTQATVAAAVQGTATAEQVAISIKATQIAGACEQATLTAYADAIEPQIRAFEQQAQLVGTTPRASLGAPLQRLLDIQTETRKLNVPVCLKDFQARVLDMMQIHQIGYQNFAAQGDETMTQASLLVGAQDLADIKRGIGTIRAGTVPPTPTALPAASAIPTTVPVVPTNSAPHAVTTDLHKQLTIFAGPGPDYPLVEDILNARQTTFLAVRVISGDHWYHVQTDGKEGWARIVGLDAAILNALPQDTSPLPPVPSPTP